MKARIWIWTTSTARVRTTGTVIAMKVSSMCPNPDTHRQSFKPSQLRPFLSRPLLPTPLRQPIHAMRTTKLPRETLPRTNSSPTMVLWHPTLMIAHNLASLLRRPSAKKDAEHGVTIKPPWILVLTANANPSHLATEVKLTPPPTATVSHALMLIRRSPRGTTSTTLTLILKAKSPTKLRKPSAISFLTLLTDAFQTVWSLASPLSTHEPVPSTY